MRNMKILRNPEMQEKRSRKSSYRFEIRNGEKQLKIFLFMEEKLRQWFENESENLCNFRENRGSVQSSGCLVKLTTCRRQLGDDSFD